MKKFTVIALCFVLTAAILTACRGKSPEETAGSTTAPSTSATADTTEPTMMPTIPTVLPTDSTGETGTMDDATGGTDSGAARQGRRPMSMQ